MKVYIVFEESVYPYACGDIAGVFLQKKDAEDMMASMQNSLMEEQEVIE